MIRSSSFGLSFAYNRISISNEETDNIIEIAKSPKESCLLMKGISETTKNESKEQQGRFLPTILGTLAVSLLGIALAGKGLIRPGEGRITADQEF